MSDWLEEIEKEAHLFMEKDVRRMARVLRELGEVVKHIELDDTGIVYAPVEVIEAMKNLSEDAKELCVASQESSRE